MPDQGGERAAGSDALTAVIGALNGAGEDLDAVSLAELLWLSARMPRRAAAAAPGGGSGGADPATSDDLRERLPDWDGEGRPVYQSAEDGEGATLAAREVTVPRASALPDARQLASALRPLGRPWRNGRTQQLDVDATVSDYARSGELVPAFRPGPERWFDLTVAVDRSPTMAVWDATVDELLKVLATSGVFRTLRTAGIDSGKGGEALTEGPPPGRRRDGASTTGHSRRLLLVVSDCVSGGDAVWDLLRRSSAVTPTVLVNPLPPQIWRQSGLDLPAVRVSPPPTAGSPNVRLRYLVPPLLDTLPDTLRGRRHTWVPVPVVALSPHSVARWTRMLMRGDPAGCQAVLVPEPGIIPRPPAPRYDPPDGGQLVEAFLHSASSPALRLAVLCSPFPGLNTALIHLIRQELVPEATSADVAEVVVSGLFSISEGPAGGSGPVLRFRDGVRERLTARLGARDARRTRDAVSRFIAAHTSAAGHFAALVPAAGGRAAISSEAAPFADLSARTLAALGVTGDGPATSVADPADVVDAEDHLSPPAPVTPPAPAAWADRPRLRAAQTGGDRSDHRPYFFLSYAHTPRYAEGADPDMWVERLFRDLCGHVMAMTDLPAGAPAGFMDREIRSGEGWSERLGEVLATCRTFVPLYSPRYFASEMCGREWYAFAQRAVYHHARSGRPVEPIVPALWVPTPQEILPGPAERLQIDHRVFGERYATDGLYGLIKLRLFAEEYERAVYELAKRIVIVADTVQLPPGSAVDYRSVPSAFGGPGGMPGNLRLAVAAPTATELPEGRSPFYYGATRGAWNPFRPVSQRAVADLVASIVFVSNRQVDTVPFDEVLAGPEEDAPSQGPLIVLVDPWAVRVPQLRAQLMALNRLHRPDVKVVIPWNPTDPQSADAGHDLSEELARTIPRLLHRNESPLSTMSRSSVLSIKALGRVVPAVVRDVYSAYHRHAQSPLDAARPALRDPTDGS
ncbi:FxsC protein [Streptomyces pristinaespiralis]|uniref:FxsC protein n=1 Tax=Streptomyces pristinaespiralis TaxID=38300 RepID=UPI0037935D7C